jgi:xylulokinase
MREMGMEINTIRAGHANMFLSPVFRTALATTGGARIELYDTDGAAGAARGAGIGAGIYKTHEEAFAGLEKLAVIEPDSSQSEAYAATYTKWKSYL